MYTPDGGAPLNRIAMPAPIVTLFSLLGLALILHAGILCQASEEQDELIKLDEQIRLKGPYGMLSDYLVEMRPLYETGDFKANIRVARDLIGMDKFSQLIKSEEFKELAQLLASLDASQDKICNATNLSHLRQLAEKMKQYNLKPTEGNESKLRLNRLLIEFSQQTYSSCLDLLQDEWSQLDFDQLLVDDASAAALKSLEAELDFVQVIKNDYNPNLRNEYSFSRNIKHILGLLHEGPEYAKSGHILGSKDKSELVEHLNHYLLSPCKRMLDRLYVGTDMGGRARETVSKYTDLITVAIIIYPRATFQEIRVKGVGRVMICNKLLAPNASDGLVYKMVKLANMPKGLW
jgi:hypothetical protein